MVPGQLRRCRIWEHCRIGERRAFYGAVSEAQKQAQFASGVSDLEQALTEPMSLIDYSGLVSVHYSRSLRVLLLCVVGLWIAACSESSGDRKVPAGAKSSGGRHAVIETDKGAIEIVFFEADAPMAVENFRL